MGAIARPHHLPLRLLPGAFILNSGLGKRNPDPDTAAHLHAEAARAYPVIKDMDPQSFARMLSTSEIALGAALLAPFVPGAVAGAALTGFSAALLGLYFTDPEARQSDGIRPSGKGIALAKDSWLLAIGLALVAEDFCGKRGVHGPRRGLRRRRC